MDDKSLALAGIDTPELRESFRVCERVLCGDRSQLAVAIDMLPESKRPYAHALTAFGVATDDIADEGDEADRLRLITQWRAESLAELRRGRSAHPLRRALVHTVRRWDLDVAVVEELLDVHVEYCAGPAFTTFAEQRRFLRGVAGTVMELFAPFLEPTADDPVELRRLLSLLGEASTLVDIFQDFPRDLVAGRCSLPSADLRRLGLEVGDLQRRERRDALEELVRVQVIRARDLLEQAAPVAGMVGVVCRPFLHAAILAVEAHFDEVERLGPQVLVEGVDPALLTDTRPRLRRPVEVPERVPAHVAVIMDGNRRWAVQHGLSAAEGHIAGERSAVRLVDSALRLGIAHLSVFAFSTENWNRSPEELADLFAAMAEGITRITEWLHERGVRVRWCGRRDRLDPDLAAALAVVESLTSNNTVLTLNVFGDYGGHDEITAAARALAAEALAGTIRPDEISPADVARNLYAPGLPAVDLLIRTSGEQRISNFLPWHLAYAEFVFDPVHWPDFGHQHLLAALADYASRHRRFGSDEPDRTNLPIILERRDPTAVTGLG